MIWYISKLLLFSLLVAIVPVSYSKAAKRLPEVMVGQLTVKQNTNDGMQTYYGDITGNEAILNFSDENSVEFEASFESRLGLFKCLDNDLKNIAACFILRTKPSTNAIRLMRSRTFVNGKEVIELSSILYGSKLITGDVYSGSSDIINYDFLGKSIAESKENISASDAPFEISNYILNNDSQSAWLNKDGASTQTIRDFNDKLDKLASNATTMPDYVVSILSNSSKDVTLYLQADANNIITDSYQRDKPNYPEGKVWLVNGDLVIGSNKTVLYQGIGTIVVKGNLSVGNGTKIIPAVSGRDQLGIVVLEK